VSDDDSDDDLDDHMFLCNAKARITIIISRVNRCCCYLIVVIKETDEVCGV
jgi:hypothetical protein